MPEIIQVTVKTGLKSASCNIIYVSHKFTILPLAFIMNWPNTI